jgi:hypothetical protein
MNTFPAASFDRWLTTPPEPSGVPCAHCDEAIAVEPGDEPIRVAAGEYVCSWKCEAAWKMHAAEGLANVMKAIAYAMGEDVEPPLVEVRLNGGGRVYRGTVVDWNVDGTKLVVEQADGTEREVRLADARGVEVIGA